MSRYLSIECDWLDQPLAVDPLERRTWARVRIDVGGCTVTRLWDRQSLAERLSIYVPAFPLARWIAANWWTLTYEPARSDRIVPSESYIGAPTRAWLARHCFRSAASGILVPRLCLYGDGRGVVADWSADEADAFPHMPGQFVGSQRTHLPLDEVENSLREFVAGVVARLAGDTDQRALEFKRNWEAICRTDAEEAAFCSAAGRLGLDPYESEGWDGALAELLERELGELSNRPIVADFLEASEPSDAVELWKWVEQTRVFFDLERAPSIRSTGTTSHIDPAREGYRLAAEVRSAMGIRAETPIVNLSDSAAALGIAPLVFREHDHLGSPHVLAAVGWRDHHEPIVAGPRRGHARNVRFLEARGLYHAAFACQKGPRLITNARTLDQQTSRAFAAELLAPQAGLVSKFDPSAWATDAEAFAETLADEFNVSAMVVRHQLENAGVDLGDR